MAHPMKGNPIRAMVAQCKCGKGGLLAIVTDEEVIMRATHEGEEDHGISLSLGTAMAFAMDILGPALYGCPN